MKPARTARSPSARSFGGMAVRGGTYAASRSRRTSTSRAGRRLADARVRRCGDSVPLEKRDHPRLLQLLARVTERDSLQHLGELARASLGFGVLFGEERFGVGAVRLVAEPLGSVRQLADV